MLLRYIFFFSLLLLTTLGISPSAGFSGFMPTAPNIGYGSAGKTIASTAAKAVAKIGKSSDKVAKGVTKGTKNTVKPLGRGSTGRTVANNLIEQLAMKEIMSNPSSGIIIKKSLSDSRWKGWTKMSNKNAHGVEIHFNAQWENGVIKLIDDFKFISP